MTHRLPEVVAEVDEQTQPRVVTIPLVTCPNDGTALRWQPATEPWWECSYCGLRWLYELVSVVQVTK